MDKVAWISWENQGILLHYCFTIKKTITKIGTVPENMDF